jgi:NAD(P)-dependent dehydrogenase (short-subunit alcohol dehydrogenase family)
MKGHVVVTGANRGIGFEIARQAGAAGARVSAVVRDPARAGALEGAAGVGVHGADVTDPDALARVAAALDAPVDLLVCNAGQYVGRGRIGEGEFGRDAWERVLMTNVAGVFLTVEAFLPALRRAAEVSGLARVAVISSQMGVSARAPGGSYVYRASKAAATNLARNLAVDLKAEGIAVAAYHPGWVSTDMGGAGAPVDARGSAEGLLARFEALTLATAGAFEDYRGEAMPF